MLYCETTRLRFVLVLLPDHHLLNSRYFCKSRLSRSLRNHSLALRACIAAELSSFEQPLFLQVKSQQVAAIALGQELTLVRFRIVLSPRLLFVIRLDDSQNLSVMPGRVVLAVGRIPHRQLVWVL